MDKIKKKWEKDGICIPKTHFQKKYVHKYAKKLREIISEAKINDLAKRSGWMERERKFKGMALLKAMVFMGNGHYQLSLRERCCGLLGYGVKISKQALDKRLNEKASVFIKSVLEEVLKLKLTGGSMTGLGLLKNFKALKIIDATSFQLPENLADHYVGFGGGASKSGIKNHYRVDITNGDQMDVEITDGISTDTATALIRGQPGDLLLFDLGYFSLKMLQGIAADNAWYVSRIRYNTQVWLKTPDGFELLNWQDQDQQDVCGTDPGTTGVSGQG